MGMLGALGRSPWTTCPGSGDEPRNSRCPMHRRTVFEESRTGFLNRSSSPVWVVGLTQPPAATSPPIAAPAASTPQRRAGVLGLADAGCGAATAAGGTG